MFITVLKEHQDCMSGLTKLAEIVGSVGDLLVRTLESGHKILICGNGGSAADAQHFAAELISRFERERVSWPAVALTTDTSIITAIGNDYGFEDVFSRQVQGLGRQGDILIGISTSGRSENVLRAVAQAKAAGMQTVGLLGCDGGALAAEVDHAVVVENPRTARIQEGHIFILHYWAKHIEHILGRDS